MVLSSRGVKLTSPSIWLPFGPLHSRCTAKVAPSRFLLRMVQRPNTESMSRAVIVTRDTSDPSPVHGVFSVYVPTIGKSSSPSTCVANVASATMPSTLDAIGGFTVSLASIDTGLLSVPQATRRAQSNIWTFDAGNRVMKRLLSHNSTSCISTHCAAVSIASTSSAQ